MSMSPYDQNVTLVANTELHVSIPLYYERIIVTNETAGTVYVRTDGGIVATTTGNFGATVLPTAWRMVGNDQPKQQPILTGAGSPQQEGWTTQNKGFQGATTPNLNPMASGGETFVSLICASAGTVGLEFV